MREYILFVDTETSGLPKKFNEPVKINENSPYIIQLAWILFTRDGKEIKSESHYIYAPDIVIDPESRKVHGITQELLREKGERRRGIYRKLYRDLKQYKPLLVGHFIQLDSHMLQLGFRRAGIKNIIKEFPHFCTMKATSDYATYPNAKYPQLGFLYENIFKRPMENQHNALADCRATAECFFELWRRGDIDEQVIQSQKPTIVKVREKVKKPAAALIVLVVIAIVFILFVIFI